MHANGRGILVVVLGVVFGAGDMARGQMRGGHGGHGGHGQRVRQLMRSPTYRSGNTQARNPLGAYGGTAYRGFQTRADRLNQIVQLTTPRGRSVSPIRREVTNPAEMLLENRNLLSVRSPLGRRAQVSDDYRDYANSVAAPSDVTSASDRMWEARPTTGAYLDTLDDRLQAKAYEHYEIGRAYFLNGHFDQAKASFGMDREINRDKARPFIADVFVAGETRDMNRAFISLLLGLSRARQAEDVWISKADFFSDMMRLDRTIAMVNLQAGQNPDSMPQHLMLAFYAWINGDQGTARTAVARAERIAVQDDGPNIKLVRRLAAFIEETEVLRKAQTPGEDR